MPNVLENLHRNLTADGYQLGSLDDFKKAMADSTKAANLYNNLSADGYQLGSQEDFFNNVRQMPQGFGQLDTRQAQQMMMGKGPISWEQPETPDHQETVAEKQRRMLSGNATQQEERQVQKRVGQRMDEIAYEQETGKRLRQPVKDIEFEAPTVERDYVGNIRHDDNGNIITGFTTDQDAVSSHQQIGQEQAEWDALSDKEKQERTKQMQLQREMDEYEEPGFLGVTGKKLASGFINAGVGALKALEELADGMIVEDASSSTGYSRVPDFDPTANDPITKGLRNAGEYAERLSRQGEPRKGASFTDLLKEGDISGFLLKGWGTGMESIPMTLSAYNPVTMGLNAMSMAGNNYWQETIENPEIPAWKRATYAVGTAAIEQAVEKFADPVFKYVGGGFGKKVAKEVTEEAEKTIAKRIVNVVKDAAGEGAEEIITNFGNDALGQALDWMDGESDYGLAAQWNEYKKQNPNAKLEDFALNKADEAMNSFFGGALAGAYTSGGAQATIAGLQYALGKKVSAEQITRNPEMPVHPLNVNVAQAFDKGYTATNEDDINAAKADYEAQRKRATETFGEIRGLDENPMQTLQTMHEGGFTEEQIQTALDYVNAKAAMDGIQQRIIEDNRASRPNYVVNGNNIDEVDAGGNVINTHEYANKEEMKAGLWELQAKREHEDMIADIAIAQLNPKYDYDALINGFAEQAGLDVSYIESVLRKDPLELEDGESAIVAEFADLLHNTIYDGTTVHEEQSAQDGANLADSMGIDMENIDQSQAQQAEALTESLNAAQQALSEAFARNEDLKQEVELMEQQGMPHQGIVASLDTFSQQERQAVIDYYNAQAKFQGFLNEMSGKIDEEAANSRQRHTFKGTIDGVADLNNVHTISDGTNKYYLVSGNVTTDPATGRITGSTSGLIIGMDLDGSFVQLSEDDGYSVDPVNMSLDQFEEAERTRLQQQVTKVIDPNGTMTQQPTEQQSGNVGGEAGAENSTGANEPPTPEPVNPPQPVNPQSPSGGESQPQQPAVTIESVTDKDGIKRYENGIEVDDAIADIQNDGFDVNEIADASIAEAQQAIELDE